MEIMKKIFFLLKTVFVFSVAYAQQGVAINTDGSNADNKTVSRDESSAATDNGTTKRHLHFEGGRVTAVQDCCARQ
jgi:hypothetical protein